MDIKDYIKTDVVIVGSGVAGLFAALCLPSNKDILLITKEKLKECDSYLAQGGVCVLKDINDFNCYYEDTMKAGHYENNPESVKIMIEASTDVIGTLVKLGVNFDRMKRAISTTHVRVRTEETEYCIIRTKQERKLQQPF